ncbi:hypothetical protein Ddye_014730 [Dipteronia dyeriana]|uniref:Uncharacterized protein n=1 Tax=Dipteronia dyeriana TaxID=168575 RepID=A0AAD9X8K8_9ROSI|nr:hypothetical protein Ddye_014730 [Dipteronia dyeriana]
MCHPSFDPMVGVTSNYHQGRRLEVRRDMAARDVEITQQASTAMMARDGGGGGGGGATKKSSVCICSITSHPGSFRCRYHRIDYKWVGRAGATKSMNHSNQSATPRLQPLSPTSASSSDLHQSGRHFLRPPLSRQPPVFIKVDLVVQHLSLFRCFFHSPQPQVVKIVFVSPYPDWITSLVYIFGLFSHALFVYLCLAARQQQ